MQKKTIRRALSLFKDNYNKKNLFTVYRYMVIFANCMPQYFLYLILQSLCVTQFNPIQGNYNNCTIAIIISPHYLSHIIILRWYNYNYFEHRTIIVWISIQKGYAIILTERQCSDSFCGWHSFELWIAALLMNSLLLDVLYTDIVLHNIII